MKLQNEDDEEYGRLSLRMPTVILVASLAIFAVLAVVLLANNSGKKKTTYNYNTMNTAEEEPAVETEDKLTADDLNFWDMYQDVDQQTILDQTMTDDARRKDELEQREADMRQAEADAREAAELEASQNVDPATDGKHTLVTHMDGTTEWMAINSSLGLNTYEDTSFQSKNGIIGYYNNGRLTSKTGADISQYTSSIDWNRLSSEVDYVMIRVGARGYDTGNIIPDSKFADNVTNAVKAGIPFGVYFSSQATTEGEALEEATYIITQLATVQAAIENTGDQSNTSQNSNTNSNSTGNTNGTNNTPAGTSSIDPSRYNTTTTTKDADGNVTTLIIDEKGNTTTTVVNPDGKQISRKTVNTDPYGNETTVITDADGNQTVTTINKNTGQVVTDASQAAGAATVAGSDPAASVPSATGTASQPATGNTTQIVSGRFHVTYPVVIEMHMIPNTVSRLESANNSARTTVIKTFSTAVGRGGYNTLFSANKEFMLCRVNMSALSDVGIWLTNEGDLPDYPYRMDMWKYNSRNNLLKSLTGEYGVSMSFTDYSLR